MWPAQFTQRSLKRWLLESRIQRDDVWRGSSALKAGDMAAATVKRVGIFMVADRLPNLGVFVSGKRLFMVFVSGIETV